MGTYNAQCSQIHKNNLSGCVKMTGSVRISSSKTLAWSNPKSLQSSLQSCEGDPVADVMVSACCHGRLLIIKAGSFIDMCMRCMHLVLMKEWKGEATV